MDTQAEGEGFHRGVDLGVALDLWRPRRGFQCGAVGEQAGREGEGRTLGNVGSHGRGRKRKR